MFKFIENSDIPENSFNMILTVSNHPPYDVDLKKEGCPVTHLSYLDNKIWHHWYADKSIADFIKNTSAKYPDSLFIITGDHPSRMIPKILENDITATNAIPIIFYGEAVKNLKREIPAMTHLDIMPTLIDMIAPKNFEYKTWGSSIFTEKRNLPPLNTDIIVINDNFVNVNSSDCPEEFRKLHRMYLALAYYRSITDGSLKRK